MPATPNSRAVMAFTDKGEEWQMTEIVETKRFQVQVKMVTTRWESSNGRVLEVTYNNLVDRTNEAMSLEDGFAMITAQGDISPGYSGAIAPADTRGIKSATQNLKRFGNPNPSECSKSDWRELLRSTVMREEANGNPLLDLSVPEADSLDIWPDDCGSEVSNAD